MKILKKSAVTEQQCFRRVTDLLGLGKERRRSNLRHFTIHSLRSYTFTQWTKTHNADLAHAYIGREQYLDTYLNMPEEEQLEYFLKVEPLLFINEAEPETQAVIQLREDNKKTREELDQLKSWYSNLHDFMALPPEDKEKEMRKAIMLAYDTLKIEKKNKEKK